ncbi:MAG: hypothetical protein K6G40_00255, partial [Eubacterium sp.]|nr:hypothetical protein [Eubacterium sp.]
MKKNFSKQILGLCLAAAVALTSIGANVTEAWAKSSEASVVGASVENATVLGTSTVTSALAEMG